MIIVPRSVSDRRAALSLASAACALDGGADLLILLEVTGLIPAPTGPRRKRRPCHRSRRGYALRPLPGEPRQRPANPCPVGACPNAAPAPGVPCARCMAALDGYLRPCEPLDVPGEAA